MPHLDPLRTAELQLLFGALPDAVLIADGNGRLEFLNPAAEHLTRHTQQDAEGKPLAGILPLGSDIDAAPLENPAATCIREGSSRGPFVAKLLTGPVRGRVVEVSAAPLRNSDARVDGAILIVRDVTRARLQARRLAHRATHDPLTGLVNRPEFERRLGRAFAGATQRQSEHVVGFLDLDGFKRINDTCGHSAGDELLRQLSAVIATRIRARDTVARLGGDEFGILMEHCTPAEGARIGDDIRRAVARHTFACDGTLRRVGVSIGLVSLLGQSSPVEALRLADLACYRAKHGGGNRVEVQGSWESDDTGDAEQRGSKDHKGSPR
jgi:diguanylate cyclase (GGDEF)-like protein/PAS domain S-box-containing protein